MSPANRLWLLAGLIAYAVFLIGAKNLDRPLPPAEIDDAVVLPPALQLPLYFGDRYLAANVESTRVLVTGGSLAGVGPDYFSRVHRVAATLNACHEDNYYVANALLAWAGSVDTALSILRDASACRYWDDVPPFFLGYNLYFFKQDHRGAKEALFLAAERSPENRVALQKFAIMLEAETYPDPRRARAYLVSQREQTRDQKLRQLLAQRIARLDGLIVLRDAQDAFERRFKRPLEDPRSLLTTGLLKEFPTDPLRLGYEYGDGKFSLREVKIGGMDGVKK